MLTGRTARSHRRGRRPTYVARLTVACSALAREPHEPARATGGHGRRPGCLHANVDAVARISGPLVDRDAQVPPR